MAGNQTTCLADKLQLCTNWGNRHYRIDPREHSYQPEGQGIVFIDLHCHIGIDHPGNVPDVDNCRSRLCPYSGPIPNSTGTVTFLSVVQFQIS